MLKKYEGKKLTKRSSDAITNAIKAANLFPKAPTCYFAHPGELSIWDHASIPYDQRITFYICPDTVPTNDLYHGSWIGEFHNSCLGHTLRTDALEVRIAARTRLLNDKFDLQVVAMYIQRIRDIWDTLDNANEQRFPRDIVYEAQRLTGLKRDYSYQEDRS